MDHKKYSKTTWIVTIVLAVLSISMDVLILTGVWASDPMMKQSAVLMLVVAAYILFASVKALIAKCKEEKSGEKE